MDCREVQNRIRAYIDGTMTMHELRLFLDHVEHCSSCYEELETFFIVDRTVQRLSSDEESDFNIKGLLQKDIRQKRRFLRHHHMWKAGVILLSLLVVLAVSAELIRAFGVL